MEIKKTFLIKGMHCASCVMVIEDSLSQLPGVLEARVNFATETATITFDDKKISADDLVSAISQAGYAAEIRQELRSEKAKDSQKKQELSKLKIKLISGLILGGLIFWGTFPIIEKTAPEILKNFYVQFILALPVQFWVGWQFYQSAFQALKQKRANMDCLIVIGTSAAFIYSLFAVFYPQIFQNTGIEPMPYFDVSVVVISLVLLGRFLEARAREKTSDAIKKLVGLQAQTARVIKNGQETDIAIEQVVVGDVIRVKPGEKIPVDGEILEGETFIDGSMISGESMPVNKKKGDLVIGATLNQTGTFIFKATKVGENTMLSQIIKLVAEAQGSKAGVQRLVDTFAAFFVPTVLVLAMITFLAWYFFGPAPTLLLAMFNSIAVLIIACPCAMGLATPTAIMVGVGKGAEKGILVRDAASLETAFKVNTVIFDKTGTLTYGKPVVTDIIGEKEVLQWAASLEKNSEHSLAKAILRKAEEEKLDLKKVEKFKALPGYGIEGMVGKDRVVLGNTRLMNRENIDITHTSGRLPASCFAARRWPARNDCVLRSRAWQAGLAKLEGGGKTVMMLGVNGKLAGLIAVADTVKDSARVAVEKLQEMDLEVMMISGDNYQTAEAIAKQAGISKVLAEVLPNEKEREVKKIQNEGRIVAMVGDGINDAPALAAADIGIAVGTGTDIAMETAGIVLINQDLKSVVSALKLSKKTMETIKFNLFWAFGYNIILIPVAMGILYPFSGILMNPIFASAAMALSSVSVVSNSLLLRRAKI